MTGWKNLGAARYRAGLFDMPLWLYAFRHIRRSQLFSDCFVYQRSFKEWASFP